MTERPSFHLQMAALEFSDSLPQKRADADAIFAREAQVTFFTEARENSTRDILRKSARKYGMGFIPGPNDGCFAIGPGVDVKGTGTLTVNPADPRAPRDGGHGPRSIDWVKVKWYGETIFVHGAHWLTIRDERERLLQHQQMTQAMVEVVQKHGAGTRLAFWMGDTNVDDAVDRSFYDSVLEEGQLTSIWDSAGEYPNTHGRSTIDVIGSYDPDRRVSLARMQAWPKGHSDHSQVSAWFDITPMKE